HPVLPSFPTRRSSDLKWFSFCFNGQLANYSVLKEQLLNDGDHHLSLDTDTEIILHEIGRILSESRQRLDWLDVIRQATSRFDGRSEEHTSELQSRENL